MFDLLLESSHRDDSNKRSNIGFGQEIMELASIEVYFTHVIWSSGYIWYAGYSYGILVGNMVFWLFMWYLSWLYGILVDHVASQTVIWYSG